MGYSPKQIKEIKHKMKNGKLQTKTISLETSLDQVQELAFISAMGNYLDNHGIDQDVISFLDDALAGDAAKGEIANRVAIEFKKSFDALGITENDVKSVTIVNKDAYDSPEQFLREEGLIK